MIFGYIRVSCDKQTVENQRFEINKYCKQNNLKIDLWIEETASGTLDFSNRSLGKLLNRIEPDDIIICSELSRLGRNLFMIIEVLSFCAKKKCKLHTVKDNFHLEDNLEAKVLAFAFGLSAEIERNLISLRTKEALARKKAEGKKLGRPKGSKNRAALHPLYGKQQQIKLLIENRVPKKDICQKFHCSRSTLYRYIQANAISD